MSTLALVADIGGTNARFALADTSAPPRPGPGEALVRVLRIGVCGTDFHAFEGTQPYFSYPRILGHELAVEVVALGAGAENSVQIDATASKEKFLKRALRDEKPGKYASERLRSASKAAA